VGYVDLPSAAGVSDTISLVSYADNHTTDINANGKLIAKVTNIAALTIPAFEHLDL